MAPPKERILRFPQSRKKTGFILVQAASTGDQPLDLDLVGTDGYSPFMVALRESRISRLQHSCDDDEWAEILKAVFCQQPKDGVQATAKVEGDQLTIEIRRMAAGMTKHVGDIALPLKPEQRVDVVGWCGTSILAFEECNQQLSEQKDKTHHLEREVKELQAQLDELVEAKKADESELMEKFRDLLNEKKVKIREQQRILATASIDSDKLAADQVESQRETQGHRPGPSRTAKRKVDVVPEDDSDDGFEKMDVEKVKKESPADSEDARTTDTGSDNDATASEDDDDEEVPGPTSSRARPAARQAATASKPTSKPPAKQAEAPPARRNLPFATRKPKEPPPKQGPKASTAAAAADAVAAGSETESDDEL